MSKGVPLTSVVSRGTDEEQMVQSFPPSPGNVHQGRGDERRAGAPRYQSQVVRSKQ